MRIAHLAVRTLAEPIILGALRLYDPNPRAILRNKKDSSVEHLWSSIPRQISSAAWTVARDASVCNICLISTILFCLIEDNDRSTAPDDDPHEMTCN